uniref:Tyrosine-protein phosphatase non-receptor type 23 n=1 Tax=Sinocyclocheilus anshuiensis TaxID=1608454 RepID=A0A671LLV1_9TELE
MEAVPRMPMIWLDLKEAGEFQFSPTVKQFILKNYGEDPDNYNEQLKKLEQLRQSAVNVTRDFEGCSTLRKYFGQLHYLQSRVPLGLGQEAAVPISWTEIFSGKTVTHEDICYEQACILYNLGELGMKVSCTHFQCSAGAFTYLRDHFSHNFSVDMSHQILNLNINLMLGQAQECLLEKSMLDNRKSFLVARISAQVVDYYKEACRALENSETASMLGKIQKDWKKLVQMKIYYFAAIAHLHMGKQAEEQQKYGERVAYLQSSLDKLSEAIKMAKGQPDSVQEALRFTMDIIGGKFNSAKKDNDFIYHESVPTLETLTSVKGAPLVKALPVNPTDPSVTGPDIFAKLVPMSAHEASSLYSEEKAKLLRIVMAKIDSRNETLEQFMDSLGLDPESVDNMEMYNTLPSVLMEKCAALSVRPDTVKNLIQSMQVLSGVFTDVEASLREIRDVLDEDAAEERRLEEAAGKQAVPEWPSALAELRRDLEKYLEAHEKASFTNTELHRAMNLHISNLRLLGGPLDTLREALPRPQLSEDEMAGLQTMKRILGKVQEMRDQRSSLEKQLRDLIQQDDITTSLVTTEHAEMKKLFKEQLKKYEQVKLYLDQNLTAQENILKALTEANVQYATVRKGLAETEHKWNSTVQMLVASYEAYEDLMKKSQEGKEFYEDLETKASRLLDKAKTVCKARKEARQAIMEKELKKKVPQRPTAPKPPPKKGQSVDPANLDDPELAELSAAILALGGDLPEELRSLPPELTIPPSGHPSVLSRAAASSILRWPGANSGLLYTQPRFPPNLPPPEVLAQISRFQTPPLSQSFSHSLLRPPLTQQQFPQLPNPQVLPPPSVPGYCPPSSQNQPGPPVTPVRPSTTTVDSVQTPIPSYSPASAQAVMPRPGQHQPMPPVSSVYAAPPQMTPHVQYMQQPGAPMSQPSQAMPAPHPQPQPQPQQVFAQQGGQSQPQLFYSPVLTQQQMPRPLPGPQPPQHTQPQFPQYIAQVRQPGPPNFHQPASATVPVQPQVPHGPLSSQIQMHPSAPSQHQNHPHPQILPQSCPPALPHIIYKPQPTIPPSSAPLSFPGGVPMVSNQSVAPLQPQSQPPTSQPLAPQQLPPGGSISYVVPQGGNIAPGTMQHPVAAASPGPQSMITPSSGAPGAPQPHVLPSPALTPTGPVTPSDSTLFQRQNSSTDDLLSSSPESQHGGTKDTANVLLPTKADPQEEHHRKKAEAVRLIQGDPYQAPERVSKLSAQLERFRSTVQSLERPTGEGGLSKLDAQWKELQEQQEKDTRQLSIAIARCYTMKNRHQYVMPYDCNRVVLCSGKDDYINASFIEDLSPYCPRLIATQAPLTGTAADFWLMVYEQKVSVIVMLVSEQELEKQKVLRYFPSERGQQLPQGPITLTLTTQKSTPTHIERMIGLQYRDQSLRRTVVHIQFTSWPELGLPESKSNLIRFIQEVHGHYLLQRPLHTPVVVHCSSGVGRTGAFCLLYAALQEIEAGNGIPDLIQLVRKMRQQRKNMLQEKLHLKFCYEAVLKHTEQVLQRHGIITSPCTRTPNNISYSRQESQDIVLGGDMPISSIQATVAKLSIRPPSVDHEQEPGQDQMPSVSEAASTAEPDSTDMSLQPSQDLLYEAMPDSLSPPLSCTSSPGKTQSPSPPSGEGNEFTGSTPASPVSNHHPSTEAAPHAPSPPPSSSLDLLASLSPEAFTLDSAHRGKQRINKQSFLQPQEGKGLQGPPEGDDPLSSLDPLWTLNKS